VQLYRALTPEEAERAWIKAFGEGKQGQ
jgi:hypothetical protein